MGLSSLDSSEGTTALSQDQEVPQRDIERDPGRSVIRRGLQQLLLLLAFGVCCQTTCHLLGGVHPLLELASHCCVHVLIVGSLLLPILWFLGHRRVSAAVALSCMILLVFVEPWSLYCGATREPNGMTQLRVLSWNVLAVNPQVEQVAELVAKADADVVVLIEVRPEFMDLFPEWEEAYPIRLERPSWAGEGIAVMSRVEGTELRLEDFTWKLQPAIIANIPAQSEVGASLQLVAMHALSPIPTYRSRIRDNQLSAISSWVSEQDGPVCLCGDLNITPWAAPFRQLVRSGFQDSRVGCGNSPTWPSALGAFGIPIDHVLYRGKCQIVDRRVLAESPGSDHRPVLFTVDY